MSSTDRSGPPTPALVDGSGQVLDLVRRGRAHTVSEMAAAMGVARSTILQRLGFLRELGLVESESQPTGSRGRPASVARFNAGAGAVLAAHLGLTGCRVAVTDLGGAVLADDFLTVELAQGPKVLYRKIERGFATLLDRAGVTADRVVGIGVGTPSNFELRAYARSLGQTDVDWDREYFRHRLWRQHQVPVLLDLDVNLLALAEHRMSWPQAEVLVCVKLGTLIDAAVVVNGVPVRGANHLAGELGHLKITGTDAPCACGSRGCLDAVASGSALVRAMVAAGHQVDHVSQVVRLANTGEPNAVHLIREAGRRIGEALSSVVNLLNPEVISTWGYLTEAESLAAGIKEGLYQSALPGSSEHLELVSTTLGDLAGVRGAAMLAIDEVLEPHSVDRTILNGSWSVPDPVIG